MALSNNELSKEQEYLSIVFNAISNEMRELETGLALQYKSIINANKDFKEDVPILNGGADFDQIVEIYKFNDIVESEEQRYNNMNARLRVLRQMFDSAYFGKIEFLETSEPSADQYYIGISTLRNNTGDFLVLDWRAPVCSLYYEFESGKCSYECPQGIIDGELLSKRQFGIFRDKINYVFDTDVLIEDKLLCNVLSQSRDKKMGNIVKSIQKEQNSAIRKSGAKNLVIFGPAGSGKTSVAMHRAAFLLYKHRETIKSKNILILSPNSIFKDYISDVLPDLGESEVNMFTITELFKPLLDNFNILGHGELMEQIINEQSPKIKRRIKRASFKNSSVFLEILKRYALFVDKNDFKPQTISYNDQIILSAEEIQKLYYEDWAGMSYSQRLKRISSRVRVTLDEVIEKRRKEIEIENADLFSWEIEELANKTINKEFASINAKIRSMFSINTVALYADMYKSREFYEQIKDVVTFDFDTFSDMFDPASYFNKHDLYWEDMFPLLFVKCIIDGQQLKFDDNIRFVIVDEFQDIPPVGLYVVQHIFERASITLVGDVNQTIDSTAQIYDEDILNSCLKSTDIFKLTKSYRSTNEITQFANGLIRNDSIEYMDRHGDPVEIKDIPDFEAKIGDMLLSIDDVRSRGLNSIGIICKNAKSANQTYTAIKNRVNASLVITDKDAYNNAVTVIPSYLAKGLEFDAVYVFDADKYRADEELRLFYTVCTRAMHKLVIYGNHM